MKAFPIDFVRQAIEQTMLEEHIKNNKYFGGINQVSLFSFYEQLVKDEEVNRYVERYRELSEQQNRSGIIMNGTIVSPENPTITNLYSHTIIPMSFTCSFRVKLANRDSAIETINRVIELLKGRKVDMVEFLGSGKLFKVGIVGRDNCIRTGDFVYTSSGLITDIPTSISNYQTLGLTSLVGLNGSYLYYLDDDDQIAVAFKTQDGWQKIVDDGTRPDVVFPTDYGSFIQWKLSLSFDSIRCDEPRILNGDEYCTISFGGSATLVDSDTKLGNDMIEIGLKRHKLVAKTTTDFTDDFEWLEPLEIPSSSNADTQANQLISNAFLNNSHTDNLTLSLQYTFICEENNGLIGKFFDYARYGIQDYITPNIIYQVSEVWCSFGDYKRKTYLAKIVESIDIENTESDTLTITIPFQIQGANN